MEERRGNGTGADNRILAAMEQTLFENYLFHLSEKDQAAVNFARFRGELLRTIPGLATAQLRNTRWQEIEEIDAEHGSSDIYQGAVWVLELLQPPLKDKDGGYVLLLLKGKGSSYVKDDEGNVRPRVVTE